MPEQDICKACLLLLLWINILVLLPPPPRLFIWKASHRDRESSSTCWSTPQIDTTSRVGPGRRQNCILFPTWVVRAEARGCLLLPSRHLSRDLKWHLDMSCKLQLNLLHHNTFALLSQVHLDLPALSLRLGIVTRCPMRRPRAPVAVLQMAGQLAAFEMLRLISYTKSLVRTRSTNNVDVMTKGIRTASGNQQ